jgi:hypothetical protein
MPQFPRLTATSSQPPAWSGFRPLRVSRKICERIFIRPRASALCRLRQGALGTMLVARSGARRVGEDVTTLAPTDPNVRDSRIRFLTRELR